MLIARAWSCAALCLSLTGCGDTAHLTANQDVGPKPTLLSPVITLIPTVHVATASRWAADQGPIAATGTTVNRFASALPKTCSRGPMVICCT